LEIKKKEGKKNLKKNLTFPDPEGPTIATFSPDLIVRLKFCNTIFSGLEG